MGKMNSVRYRYFVNGLPLSYIEVKQPNAIRDGKTGIQSEQDRTRYRFENRKFRRFNNITQLISLSDNLAYISGQGQQKQGSYYGSNAYSKTKFNAFKEERVEDFLHSIPSYRGPNRLRLRRYEAFCPQISTRVYNKPKP